MYRQTIENLAALIGRFLISFIFIFSGIHKIIDFAGNVGFVASKGMPFPTFLLIISIIVEIVAGLMVLLGWYARIAAIILSLFIIIVTLVFHPFWTYPPEQAGIQMTMFWKNFAMLGGLLYIFAFGAGKYSLKYLMHHKRK